MSESRTRPGFVTVDDYLKLPRAPNAWLVKSLIPAGGAALLYGQEKSGKSAIAVQLAAALSGGATDWLGFPIGVHGPVLYLQLDNPRVTWAQRFEEMRGNGMVCTPNLFLADRESVEHFPFDILLPEHVAYLRLLCAMRQPVAVVVDTLREVSSGDENDSTISRNVIANLAGAIGERTALILVSHARKPQPDSDKDLMADHRGSSYITGRMDAILRMTGKRLYYGGRSIEQSSIKLTKIELEETVMFEAAVDEAAPLITDILMDTKLATMREKARMLAKSVGVTEEAAMSRIRRHRERLILKEKEARREPPLSDLIQTPLILGI